MNCSHFFMSTKLFSWRGMLPLWLLIFALRASAEEGLTIGWTNNFLTVSAPWIPGEFVKINYLEAFCRSGSTHQEWKKSTIPHQTRLLNADAKRQRLRLLTTVEPGVEITHEIEASQDEVTFKLEIKNTGDQYVDVQWFQPCIRVDRFTALPQSNYFSRCFIYTERGLTMLDRGQRTEEAWYRGGQVYLPAGVNTNDVNPRPISVERPVNGLIGCFSFDHKYLLASAWSATQELCQGVAVCAHSDPRIGGLQPHESKQLKGKMYLLTNDPDALLKRYQHDFPAKH